MKTAVAAFAFFLVVFLSLALLGSSLICRSYWGYLAAPPRIDSRVTSAKRITGYGGIDTTHRYPKLDLHINTPGNQNPDPTEYPLQYDILQLKHAGMKLRESGKLRVSLTRIKQLPLDKRVRVKNDSGYNSQESLRGLWMEFGGRDGQKYLFIIADGGQVSDDHYPHYRLLYSLKPGGELELISHQVFYSDLAGMEGMNWRVLFTYFAIVAVFLAIICTGIYVAVRKSAQSKQPSS